jgi:peptidoglycan/xylan/chitin deacetylase (PgdA/CDA1 family)
VRRAGLALALALVFLSGFVSWSCTDNEPRDQVMPQPTIFTPGLTREGIPGTFTYTVQPGDTLFSLAQRYGTTVGRIIELNDIQDAGQIEVGEVLNIPNPPATTTATATPTRTATPPTTGPSIVVRNGSRNSNLVALSFDMGGRVDPALDIIEYLIENEVRATLFPTGAILESRNTDIGRQVFSLAAQHDDLFDIGNHSYSHPDFRTLTDAQMTEEIQSTAAAILEVTGYDARPWFRPPEGAYDDDVLRVVGSLGYRFTVMWDIDTIDWRPEADGGPTAAEIVEKVLANAQGGSIVLMHFGGYNTFEALPAIVSGLRAAGFELATVAEVLGE